MTQKQERGPALCCFPLNCLNAIAAWEKLQNVLHYLQMCYDVLAHTSQRSQKINPQLKQRLLVNLAPIKWTNNNRQQIYTEWIITKTYFIQKITKNLKQVKRLIYQQSAPWLLKPEFLKFFTTFKKLSQWLGPKNCLRTTLKGDEDRRKSAHTRWNLYLDLNTFFKQHKKTFQKFEHLIFAYFEVLKSLVELSAHLDKLILDFASDANLQKLKQQWKTL